MYETVGPKPPPVQDIPQVDSHFIMSRSRAYGVTPSEPQLPDVMTQNELYGVRAMLQVPGGLTQNESNSPTH